MGTKFEGMEENGAEQPPLQNKINSGEMQNTDNIPREFEDIIDGLGSFGHWQRVIFVLISLGDVHGALAMLLPVFTGADPGWDCQEFGNQNLTVLKEDYGMILNDTKGQCYLNKTRDCTAWKFETDFTSSVTEWDLMCNRRYIIALTTSIQMLGLLVGAGVFGFFSDFIGRKISYYVAFFIMILGGFISAFAHSWQGFTTCRFIVGIGFGSTMVVNCVYPLEFVGSRWRTLCGTIGFWALGQMLLAFAAYFIRNWRYLTIASSISGVVYFVTWWFVPESPRWLMQKGRFDEAEVILAKIATKNKKPIPDLSFLRRFAEEEAEKEMKLRKYTYLDLFRTKKYCKKTFVLLLNWFTVFVMYYHLALNMRNLSGNRYLNQFLAGLVDFVAMLSVIFFSNWLGRRLSDQMYLSIALVSNICILGVHAAGKGKDLPGVILAFALLGKAAALAGTYVVQIYSAELYPTVVRNLGVGAGSVSARLGGIVAPQIVLLGTYFSLGPYIITSVLCAIAIGLCFTLTETKGKPLQDKLEEEEPFQNVDTTAI